MTQAVAIAQSGTNNVTMRNRIINGAMMIDQRNAGASVTPAVSTVTYVVDRFWAYQTVASKFTVQQNAGSVTPPSGFQNYLGVTTAASTYTPGVNDRFFLCQIIEGYNVADLGFGAAGAATVTVSFWVRSSLTGTFTGALENAGGSRNYPFSYTINAANNWEQKSITIAGDTTGTWNKTNGGGIYVSFSLASGANWLQPAGSWTASGCDGATGQTNLLGTASSTFYITGVQFEAGTAATPFENRLYGTELYLCKRYFQLCSSLFGNAGGATTFYSIFQFPVEMRAGPTAAVTAPINLTYAGVAGYTQSAANVSQATSSSTTGAFLGFANFSGLGTGNPLGFNGNSQYVQLSAEL